MEHLKLSVKALAFAGAVLWGGAILMVGSANIIWPGYGGAFLEGIASVYPGYHVAPNFSSVLVGTGYAFIDGAIAGILFAWLYNLCAGHCRKCKSK